MGAPVRPLLVLATMYAAQGVVYGFAAFVLLPTLAANGVPVATQTTILALAGVPWVFKLAWGPILDRFGAIEHGRARTFASVALLAVGVGLFVLAGIDDPAASVRTIAVVWLFLNVALSLQDVATDAMALDGIAPSQRGLANGVMLGGHHVGLEGIGGMLLGAIVASRGLQSALLLQATLAIVLAIVPMLMPRPPVPARPREAVRVREAIAAVIGPRGVAVAGLAAVVFFADILTSSLSAEFWVARLGWSVETLGQRLPPLLLVANIIGYAFAAAACDRIGHRRTAAIGSLALGALWIGFGLVEPAWGDTSFLLGFVSVQAVATALLYVGIHAALMDATLPTIRATHFAVLTMLLNLPRVVAPTVAPAALEMLGWAGVFVAAGAMQAAMVLPILRALSSARAGPGASRR